MDAKMEAAIRHVDFIIERHRECVLGGVMEQILGFDNDTMADELRRRGYVVDRSASYENGYVVFPRRKKRTGPWLVVQVV